MPWPERFKNSYWVGLQLARMRKELDYPWLQRNSLDLSMTLLRLESSLHFLAGTSDISFFFALHRILASLKRVLANFDLEAAIFSLNTPLRLAGGEDLSTRPRSREVVIERERDGL